MCTIDQLGSRHDGNYDHDGDDTIWGGDGVDALHGNAGSDKLRAQDGIRDTAVDSGPDIDQPTQKDPNDPLIDCE